MPGLVLSVESVCRAHTYERVISSVNICDLDINFANIISKNIPSLGDIHDMKPSMKTSLVARKYFTLIMHLHQIGADSFLDLCGLHSTVLIISEVWIFQRISSSQLMNISSDLSWPSNCWVFRSVSHILYSSNNSYFYCLKFDIFGQHWLIVPLLNHRMRLMAI